MSTPRRGLACVRAVMMRIVTVSGGRSRTGSPVSDNPYQPADRDQFRECHAGDTGAGSVVLFAEGHGEK